MFRKLMLLCTLLAAPIAAQTDTSMVLVPKRILTPEVIQQVEQQSKIETYGKWVGLGHEVGEAVNSSLQAITTNTANFAETKVGKMTMFIILYKILGKDIVRILLAISLGTIGLAVLAWSYRNYLPSKMVLVSETVDADGKKHKTYKPIDSVINIDTETARLFHAVGALILLISIIALSVA